MIHAFGSILIVCTWTVAGILVFFLFLISRFYEIRFGQRSYHQLLLAPFSLFIIAAVWDAFFANSYTGNPLLDFVGAFGPDLLFLIGGIVLAILCYSLVRIMMGGRG